MKTFKEILKESENEDKDASKKVRWALLNAAHLLQEGDVQWMVSSYMDKGDKKVLEMKKAARLLFDIVELLGGIKYERLGADFKNGVLDRQIILPKEVK